MTDYNYQNRFIFKDAAVLVGVCLTAVAITFTFVGLGACGSSIYQAVLCKLVPKREQSSPSCHETSTQSILKADAEAKTDAQGPDAKEGKPESDPKKVAEDPLEVKVFGFAGLWFTMPMLLSLNSAISPRLRYKVPQGWSKEGSFFHDVSLWESYKYWLYIWAILSIPSLFLMLLGLLVGDLSKMVDTLRDAQKELDSQAPDTPTPEASEPFEKVEVQE